MSQATSKKFTCKNYAQAITSSFAMPDTCQRVQDFVNDPTSSLEDLAHIIEVDPSVTSKLLKLANSALFKFPAQISSVTKAVSVLGSEAVYNLVMTETASSAFEQFASENFDIVRFWKQSVYAALLGKHLARMARLRGSEQYYLVGLMHNIGELGVLQHAPDTCQNIADHCPPGTLPWEFQQETIGMTYADIGAEILKAWQLPEAICRAVGGQHQESHAFQQQNIALAFVMSRLTLCMLSYEYSAQELVDSAILSSLGLTMEDVDAAMRFAKLEAQNLLHIINPQRFR